jgi:tetratricopeptide (TPR) repeat protein
MEDTQEPNGANEGPRPAELVKQTSTERRKVKRAIGPKLRKLLYVVFGLLALLGANSGYLASITFLQWFTRQTYENYFYMMMLLGHLVLGLLLIVPFILFGLIHIANTKGRRNRRAIKVGYVLFSVSIAVLVTGLLLVRNIYEIKHPTALSIVYWMHIACPLVAGWLYWLHRLAGPKIKWKAGLTYGGVVGGTVLIMMALHSHDPRSWNVAGPKQGEKYFNPSLLRTATGNFIPARALMNDDYCKRCHADAHADWAKSAHRFGSFNNPAYLTSIRETRKVLEDRVGNIQASRWCAGCHDVVPFVSGAFDKLDFDDVNDPTAHAGITCTVCHAITNINSIRGNADFTIEEPMHYPFAFSENRVLQWVNEQLVKAKPGLHKKTFLKDFHKSTDFCSTCHKVSLPKELNDYKDFLRGQNHYDSFLLSGVSGHGASSFYYPKVAEKNCNGCHMPLRKSNDFGAKIFDDSGELKIHDHLFPGANTAVGWWNNDPDMIKRQQKFLNGVMRLDIFGVREDAKIDGQLHAPIRPQIPVLEKGKNYLLESVVRTVKLGHHFTQGTGDSNEIWLEVTVKSGDRIIGTSGLIDGKDNVDEEAHRLNLFMLDRNGKRINRRNAQDIFTPLYNHQMPPGTGRTVHYKLEIPADVTEPISVNMRLLYRKFDSEYLRIIGQAAKPGDRPIRGHKRGESYGNDLPITVLAQDAVTFPVAGIEAEVKNSESPIVPWQRWNDYGIGLFIKGTNKVAPSSSEIKQAQAAFKEVEKLGRYDGALNLARAFNQEGVVNEPKLKDDAVRALARAVGFAKPRAPSWTVAWLSGILHQQQNNHKAAEQNFRDVLDSKTQEMVDRGFDFSLDYRVRVMLAQTLFDQARGVRLDEPPADPAALKKYEQRKTARTAYLDAAVVEVKKALQGDPENFRAHYLLSQVYKELTNADLAQQHQAFHERYRPDNNAADDAVVKAKQNYPAASKASEPVVIYELHKPSAP